MLWDAPSTPGDGISLPASIHLAAAAPVLLLGGYCFPASFVAFSQFVITWIAGGAVSAATAIRKRWPSGLGAYCHTLLPGDEPEEPSALKRNSATGTPALTPPRLSACDVDVDVATIVELNCHGVARLFALKRIRSVATGRVDDIARIGAVFKFGRSGLGLCCLPFTSTGT